LIIFKSNLKRILKSRSNLIIMIIFPIVFVAISMVASYGNLIRMNVGIVDKDNTRFTHSLIEKLKEKNHVRMFKEADVKDKLINDSADYVLVIEKGFTEAIINNKAAALIGYSIQESDISLPTKYYIESYINSAKNIGAAAMGNEEKFYIGLEAYEKGNIKSIYKGINNSQQNKSNTLAALGFLIMSMLFLSNNTSQLILDDKQNKTFFRIFASPISTKNYMLQNILSSFVILIIQTALIFTIMAKVFNADFGTSIFNVYVLYLLFSLMCVSLGVAVVSISKNARQAGAINTFITVPMCMLGGCFWPIRFMPDILVKISNFMPTTWILKASDKVMFGSSLYGVRTEISVLLLFTLVFILLGSWKKADITK
jgi:ABC-2 type transport system permease protein